MQKLTFVFFLNYKVDLWCVYLNIHCILEIGWDSIAGVATSYGLGGLGLELQWAQDFAHCLDQPRGPPILLYGGYWLFPEGKAAGVWC